MINPLFHLPLSYLSREHLPTSGLYFQWIWVVTVEPQLTHLETPICRSPDFVDLFSAISFCYTNLPHLKQELVYVLKKHRRQEGFALTVTDAFRASGISDEYLGEKKLDTSWVLLIFLSCSLSFRPIQLFVGGGVGGWCSAFRVCVCVCAR